MLSITTKHYYFTNKDSLKHHFHVIKQEIEIFISNVSESIGKWTL